MLQDLYFYSLLEASISIECSASKNSWHSKWAEVSLSSHASYYSLMSGASYPLAAANSDYDDAVAP